MSARSNCIWILSYAPIPGYAFYDSLHIQEKLMEDLDEDRRETGILAYPLWIRGKMYHITRCKHEKKDMKKLFYFDGVLISAYSLESFINIIRSSGLDNESVDNIINILIGYNVESVDRIYSILMSISGFNNVDNNVIKEFIDIIGSPKYDVQYFMKALPIVRDQKYLICTKNEPPFYRGLVRLDVREEDFRRAWKAALSEVRKSIQSGRKIEELLAFDIANKEIYVGESGIIFSLKGGGVRVELTGRMRRGEVVDCGTYRRDGYILAGREEVWQELGGGFTKRTLRKFVEKVLALWRDPTGMALTNPSFVVFPVRLICKTDGGSSVRIIRSFSDLIPVIEYVKERDVYFGFLSNAKIEDVSAYVCRTRQCLAGVQLWPKSIEDGQSILSYSYLVLDVNDDILDINISHSMGVIFRYWRSSVLCDNIEK
ncbi:MAG: hypothetical protein D6732_08455 [Methanobacteriota archaeon]|nr:MAG: hypothetical protein D6732_08455 [Euryarchaeota archaeon]